MRYFFNRPQIWVMESTEISLFGVTFLVAAWLLRKEGHVSVDIVVDQLSARTRSLVRMITSVLVAIVCMIVVWYGTQVTWDHLQKGIVASELMRFPKAPLLAVIPASMFLVLIQSLRRTYGYFRSWRAPSNEEPSSPTEPMS